MTSNRLSRSGAVLGLLLAFLVGDGVAPVSLAGQTPDALRVALPSGEEATVPVVDHRGYPAVVADALGPLGWTARNGSDADGLVLEHRTGLELGFLAGSPFVDWDGTGVQMVHAPYWLGDSFHVPLQLLVDLFPGLLPGAYRFDAERFLLAVEGAPDPAPDAGASRAADTDASRTSPVDDALPPLVVIDPGHGGGDSGAIGPGGTREKDVALAVSLALARELAGDDDLEVRLTREDDREVPLWSRGEWATQWRADRPGVFVSVHANALPDRPEVRGFETYFLSEARTEHERRVAAAENAPLRDEAEGGDAATSDPLLDAILRDLRTFDHQHWSALLAEEVQLELRRIHPGPDRGVKQGPFAVITNAMMPSVLVEVGFISNPEEERLLARPEFQRDAAVAIARAVRRFFERYPPGGGR